MRFETEAGHGVQGFFYPPANGAAGKPEPGSRPPPLLVQLHGGPTSMADSRLDPLKQYWTQRGYALLDLNYRGSSGFGRAFRQSLREAWGVAEVDDLFHACRDLIRRGWVDPARIMIRGNSAGGYSVLRALVDPRARALGIRAGASHYGISDLALLARQTHKFESRYLHWLIGDPLQAADRYRARSVIHAPESLTSPLIFFQGGLDPVVPAVQTYRLYQQLRGRGLAVDYEAFSDERHGFRRAANRARVLEREGAFYQSVTQGVHSCSV
jgi:dipeptidyl aminopeptidase/acylaminoacyl peptidase